MSNWVHLISFTLDHEAHIAKSKLESEGIEVFLKDELSNQVNNVLSNAIGGVKLFVNDSEAERAVQIMIDGGFIVETSEQKNRKLVQKFKQSNKCPHCNSDNFMKTKKTRPIRIIILILKLIPLPFFKTEYHCFDCDKNWRV